MWRVEPFNNSLICLNLNFDHTSSQTFIKDIPYTLVVVTEYLTGADLGHRAEGKILGYPPPPQEIELEWRKAYWEGSLARATEKVTEPSFCVCSLKKNIITVVIVLIWEWVPSNLVGSNFKKGACLCVPDLTRVMSQVKHWIPPFYWYKQLDSRAMGYCKPNWAVPRHLRARRSR